MQTPLRSALILGANGRFGRAAVDAFSAAGWQVFAQVRRAPTTPLPAGALALPLDLADTDALARAASGSSVVVHGVNPLYTDWSNTVLPMGRQAMDVAQALGAGLMLPGNVYNFGSQPPALISAGAAQQPDLPKGRLRAALEQEMQARASQGLRSVVIRAGDFFGAGTGSWLDQLVLRGLNSGRLVYPGPRDVVHAWTYLPDYAQAFARVAETGIGEGCADLPFGGYAVTGNTFLDAVEAAAHALGLGPARAFRRSGFPWALARAAGWVLPMWHDLAEMSYLWRMPHALDGSALAARIGAEPHTPLQAALEHALRQLYPQARPVAAAGTQAAA